MNQTAIKRIREWMTNKGYDAVYLHTRANFSWLTGGKDNHIVQASEYGVADLIVLAAKLICITNQMEQRRILEEELAGEDIELVAPAWVEPVEPVLGSILSGLRVASDSVVPFATLEASSISRIRRTLDPFQIDQYRFVCGEAARVLEDTAKNLKPGMSEYEIASQITAGVVRRGLSATVALVATDERILNYRHPIPTAKTLDRYAMLVVCAEKFGLVANATRFVHFGALPAELKENKSKCAYIDVRMNAATRPGQTVAGVFQTATDAYREVGFADDWRWLHQGGPTGYASREYLATPHSDDVINLNEAYAWNPAIRGVKSEDTILVGERENEFLTQTGDWTYQEVEVDGKSYLRPDILIR